MFESEGLLLIAAVAIVGVLHTVVPDHWVPITLMARQRGWTQVETAGAALRAGTGHVLSTLLIAVVVWFAGVAAAERFGHVVDLAASAALLVFGGWIAVSAWRDMHGSSNHQGHPEGHRHGHAHGYATSDEEVQDPGFRTIGDHQHPYSASPGERLHRGHADEHEAHMAEADLRGPAGDGLYAPLAVAVRHCHTHRHGRDALPHAHWHDHVTADAHPLSHETKTDAPLHRHPHKTTGRTALLLILGSSPMLEGIPAFFAAQRFGLWLLTAMAIVFAVSTIATYVLLCVFSTRGLQRVQLGSLERYGEVLSGSFIAGIGLVSYLWPAI
jgi:hypothetical protein